MKTWMMTMCVSYYGYKKVFSIFYNVFISILCGSIHAFVLYMIVWVSSCLDVDASGEVMFRLLKYGLKFKHVWEQC